MTEKILEDVGIPLNVVNQTVSRDIYGAETVTGSTVYSVTGCVVPMRTDSTETESGIINAGEAYGYFYPSDGSIIVPGNIVIYQGKEYEISAEPRRYDLKTDQKIIETDLKRFHKP